MLQIERVSLNPPIKIKPATHFCDLFYVNSESFLFSFIYFCFIKNQNTFLLYTLHTQKEKPSEFMAENNSSSSAHESDAILFWLEQEPVER